MSAQGNSRGEHTKPSSRETGERALTGLTSSHAVNRFFAAPAARCAAMATAMVPGSAAHRRLEIGLATTFAVVWAASAWGAHFPADWLLENWLVVAAVVTLAWVRRRAYPAPATLAALWSFLVLHEIGAHYTYSHVPYDAWFERIAGVPLSALTGWQRNHYDRLVHLVFGIALVVPCRELVVRTTGLRDRAGWMFAVSLVVNCSVAYEFIEWGAAAFFGGDLGMAYLGTQGDVWDGHKDMAFATAGAVVCSLLRYSWHRRRGRDPVLEWIDRCPPLSKADGLELPTSRCS